MEIRLTRRDLLHGIFASAGLAVAFPAMPADSSPKSGVSGSFRLTLPPKALPMPQGVNRYRTAPGFSFRGIKGLSWIPSQYLETIPVMAKYKMNFLMNCYTSMFDLEPHGTWARFVHKHINHWYRPLPEEKKRAYARVVRECQRRGLEFCFSMNPILDCDRPFDYAPQDLETLWSHYAWMQGLGVRWFNVSLDDISEGIDANKQANAVNELLRRLRRKAPSAQMIFTPTWYAGTGKSGPESAAKLGSGNTPGMRYVKQLGAQLDPDVYLYWTGPEVCSLTITREDAESYRSLAKHRLFIWDNYPCNDQHAALQLGPLTGRGPKLHLSAEGYISNPLSPQYQANFLPMLTIADYTWNPVAYDPQRSIGQAIDQLAATKEQRLVLKDLVELYPGRLEAHSQSTGWNSLQQHFKLILKQGSKKNAKEFIARAASVSRNMEKQFPHEFALARQTLDSDIAQIETQYSAKFS